VDQVQSYRNSYAGQVLSYLSQGLVIIVAAAILCLPVLLVGIPNGNDASNHIEYQYHFSSQFWRGDSYPRWLAEANKGYGSPIFLAQYPFPYFVTALLRPILSFPPTADRESRELGIYCFLVLAAAGISGWFWFRSRCTATASTIAAVAYICLPYIVGSALYDRADIGELTTFVWIPLLFALCDRVRLKGYWLVGAMCAVFALLVLSNIIYAALMAPVVVLYAIASGKRALWSVVIALPVGVCIAGGYVLPLIAYRQFFDPAAFIINHPATWMFRNLLYVSLREVRERRIAAPTIIVTAALAFVVGRYVWYGGKSFISRAGMLLTLALGIVMLIPGPGQLLIGLSHLRVSRHGLMKDYSMDFLFAALLTLSLGLLAHCRVPEDRRDPRERLLLVVSCSAFVFMLAWCAPIWRIIPGTEIIQYPWRLCAILTVATAGLFAIAFDDCLRHRSRSDSKPSMVAMALVALAVIAAGTIIFRVDRCFRHPVTPHIDLAQEVDTMYPGYVATIDLLGFAKTVGTSPNTFDVTVTPVQEGVRADFINGLGSASVVRVSPRRLLVSARCQEQSLLRLGQLNFPLWKIVPMAGSAPEGVLRTSPEGLIEVSLRPGRHDFELVFEMGWPARLGSIVTVASLLAVLGACTFLGLQHRLYTPRLKLAPGGTDNSGAET
jgi:hypothetical protein